jgi:hypothetical protein
MTVTSFDAIESDLLTRLTVIQRTVTGIEQAVTRFWEPVKAPFPMFLNMVTQITPDHVTGGRFYRRDSWQVLMRCVWGSLGSGYKGETEDRMSSLKVAIINRFDLSPHLNDPTTNVEFRYLAPQGIARITGATTKGIQLDTNNPAELYLATDYTLTVMTQYSVTPKSS